MKPMTLASRSYESGTASKSQPSTFDILQQNKVLEFLFDSMDQYACTNERNFIVPFFLGFFIGGVHVISVLATGEKVFYI